MYLQMLQTKYVYHLEFDFGAVKRIPLHYELPLPPKLLQELCQILSHHLPIQSKLVLSQILEQTEAHHLFICIAHLDTN